MLRLGWICLLVLLFVAKSVASVGQPGDWAEFRRTPAAQQEIIAGKVDTNLLSMAVFYATNAERAKRELPLLKYSKTVEKAAALQSDLMRKRGGIGHENPEAPQWRTLVQRVRWAGLKYRF